MRILSVDIGIINFAFCIMDNEKKVHHWEILTLCNGTSLQNEIDLIKKLDERPYVMDVDLVIIERQPKCNPKMRVMAGALRSYFIIRGMVDNQKKLRIEDYSAKYKLRCYEGPMPENLQESNYNHRKKIAIYHCRQLLMNYPEDIQNIFENTQKKRDDLADAFLQGYSYFHFRNKKEMILLKKPTKKQLKFEKYNKHNMKYLLVDYLNSRLFGREIKTTTEDGYVELDEVIKDWLEQKEICKNYKRLFKSDYEEMKKEILPSEFIGKNYQKLKEDDQRQLIFIKEDQRRKSTDKKKDRGTGKKSKYVVKNKYKYDKNKERNKIRKEKEESNENSENLSEQNDNDTSSEQEELKE